MQCNKDKDWESVTFTLYSTTTSSSFHIRAEIIELFIGDKKYGILDDYVEGLKIVWKINSWPRIEASRACVKF